MKKFKKPLLVALVKSMLIQNVNWHLINCLENFWQMKKMQRYMIHVN